MPVVPFVGLSILIHMIVILSYKIFRKEKKSINIKDVEHTKHWASWLVVSMVLLFVFSNAFFLVRASVVDEHSSIHRYLNHRNIIQQRQLEADKITLSS